MNTTLFSLGGKELCGDRFEVVCEMAKRHRNSPPAGLSELGIAAWERGWDQVLSEFAGWLSIAVRRVESKVGPVDDAFAIERMIDDGCPNCG